MNLQINYVDNQQQSHVDRISNILEEQGIDKADSRAANKNSLFGEINGQLAYLNIGSSGDHDKDDKFHAQVIDKESGKWRDLKSNEYESFVGALKGKGAFKDRAELLKTLGREKDAKSISEYGGFVADLGKVSELSKENRDKLAEGFSADKDKVTDVSDIKDYKVHEKEIADLKQQLIDRDIAWENDGAQSPEDTGPQSPLDNNQIVDDSQVSDIAQQNDKLLELAQMEFGLNNASADSGSTDLNTDEGKKLLNSIAQDLKSRWGEDLSDLGSDFLALETAYAANALKEIKSLKNLSESQRKDYVKQFESRGRMKHRYTLEESMREINHFSRLLNEARDVKA